MLPNRNITKKRQKQNIAEIPYSVAICKSKLHVTLRLSTQSSEMCTTNLLADELHGTNTATPHVLTPAANSKCKNTIQTHGKTRRLTGQRLKNIPLTVNFFYEVLQWCSRKTFTSFYHTRYHGYLKTFMKSVFITQTLSDVIANICDKKMKKFFIKTIAKPRTSKKIHFNQ